jgi:hypothetical protein
MMIIIISSSSLPFGSPITQVCKFNLKSEGALSGLSILCQHSRIPHAFDHSDFLDLQPEPGIWGGDDAYLVFFSPFLYSLGPVCTSGRTDIHARFLSIATPPSSPLHRIRAGESYHGFTPLWTDEHEQDEDVLFGLKHCNAGYSQLTTLLG